MSGSAVGWAGIEERSESAPKNTHTATHTHTVRERERERDYELPEHAYNHTLNGRTYSSASLGENSLTQHEQRSDRRKKLNDQDTSLTYLNDGPIG